MQVYLDATHTDDLFSKIVHGVDRRTEDECFQGRATASMERGLHETRGYGYSEGMMNHGCLVE